MRIALYLNSISPHQLPFARALVARVGCENLLYVYTSKLSAGREKLGWSTDFASAGVRLLPYTDPESQEWIETADILYTGIRCLDLLERRSAHSLTSSYYSERWFKPIPLNLHLLHFYTAHILLPGWLRMVIPSYRKMSKRFLRLMNGDPKFVTLPVGPWAKKDFLRLGVRADKMLDWGYFVEPSNFSRVERVEHEEVRVLYLGRLLKLKHVDTIIRAIALLNSQPSTLNPQPSTSSTPLHLYTAKNPTPTPTTYTLTIVGDGPEKSHLQKLASAVNLNLQPQPIIFQPSVPIHEVRQIMRAHDLLIFSSDSQEGWGAVVSEALSEGLPVIGTYETGASAALLPTSQLFHTGNYKELASKLSSLQLHLQPPPKSTNSTVRLGLQTSTKNTTIHNSSFVVPNSPLTSSLPHAYTPAGAAQRFLEVAKEDAK